MNKIKNFFGSIVDVRKGEVALTLLMFVYYYLLLVTYYFLKPARDSLFLVKLGAQQLPIVFMLIAVIVVPVVTVYSNASRRLKLNQLINATTIILIANLLLLRWMLEFSHSSVFYIFYIWVSIYGALSTAQFWLLANGIFDATQAKRLFVLFGLGGIIGAFTGGEVTGFIINAFNVSTENLLFFCMGFLGICVLLVNTVWTLQGRRDIDVPRAPRRQKEKKGGYADTFRLLKQSRHLMLIVGIIAATMATASFADYQFKNISAQAFPTKAELTAFLGKFYGRLSLISFLFQLFVSYRFLRLFGVGGAIMLLPFGLLGGTISMLLYPGLVSAVLLRGSDGVFRYSIDKTGRELLFLPVPLDVKKRTKVFIDIFVDRWFRGIAGGVLLLFVTVLEFSVRQLSFVVLALVASWLVMVFMMRKEYINAFRKALERREIDLSDLRINIAESSTLETLKAALASTNERQIVYALDMLRDVQDAEIVGAIQPLLRHSSSDIRRRAVAVLRDSDDDSFDREMKHLLKDDDLLIRRDAMAYLCRHTPKSRLEALKQYLNDKDPKVRSAAVGCIAENPDPDTKALIDDDFIQSLLKVEGEEGALARAQAADVIGKLGSPELHKHLVDLMNDPEPQVVINAMRSVGRSADRDLVPVLLHRLASRKYRVAARESLTLFGDRIVGTLTDHIIDPTVDITVRSNLCRVLSHIPTQHSVDSLIGTIEPVEPELRYYVIKALNSLRSRYPDLKFNHDALNGALIDETQSYYAILQILQIEAPLDTPGGKLLERALTEKINNNVERMFRLLGLQYSQNDIHGAYLGIIGNEKQLRASAVEFLDNVLRKEVKKYLFPIVDNIEVDLKIKKGRELFDVDLAEWNSALVHLIKGHDPWLRACALYAGKDADSETIRELAKAYTKDPHVSVKEAALIAASSIERS